MNPLFHPEWTCDTEKNQEKQVFKHLPENYWISRCTICDPFFWSFICTQHWLTYHVLWCQRHRIVPLILPKPSNNHFNVEVLNFFLREVVEWLLLIKSSLPNVFKEIYEPQMDGPIILQNLALSSYIQFLTWISVRNL